MKALGLKFDVILTSPLTRCRQTARVVAGELGTRRAPEVLRTLAPGGAPREILASITAAATGSNVLLVGHEPDLSRLAAFLLLSMPADFSMEFKKGGLCRIDFEGAPRPGGGSLALLLSPRVLRRMA